MKLIEKAKKMVEKCNRLKKKAAKAMEAAKKAEMKEEREREKFAQFLGQFLIKYIEGDLEEGNYNSLIASLKEAARAITERETVNNEHEGLETNDQNGFTNPFESDNITLGIEKELAVEEKEVEPELGSKNQNVADSGKTETPLASLPENAMVDNPKHAETNLAGEQSASSKCVSGLANNDCDVQNQRYNSTLYASEDEKKPGPLLSKIGIRRDQFASSFYASSQNSWSK